MLPSSFGIDTTPYLLAPWESGMPNATLKSVKNDVGLIPQNMFLQVFVTLVLLFQNLFIPLHRHSSEKDCEINSPYESSDVWHFCFFRTSSIAIFIYKYQTHKKCSHFWLHFSIIRVKPYIVALIFCNNMAVDL